MQRVSVSDLKARLSHYLREVKRGGEIQVLERGVPVARITASPARFSGDDDRQRLIDAGVIRPGSGEMAAILERPPLDLGITLSDAVLEDRADRV